MSELGTAHRRPTPEKGYSRDMSKMIEDGLRRTGLDQDAINGWSSVSAALQLRSMEGLHPLRSYEEYVASVHGESPEWIRYILDYSDPVKVAHYNALVADYNRRLPAITAQNDFDALQQFQHEIKRLLTIS